ncbi:hypothetical protein HDU67_008288 [Dinochytrium kinnereticum]|nr:hypothetical protein HDU67_008288 [Dinochytrium kinnereticum]
MANLGDALPTLISSPTPMANFSKVFYVADPSVSGSLLFLMLAIAVSFVCVGLHEVLRRYKSLHKILYTRVETCRKDSPEISSYLFGWIMVCIKTPESYIIEKVGLDATMLVFEVLAYFRVDDWGLDAICGNGIPVLIPINFFAGVPSRATNIVLVTDGMTLTDIGLFRFSISNVQDGSSFLLVHALFVFVVTLVVYVTTYLNYKSFAGLATDYLKEETQTSSERPAWRKSEAVQLRTVIVQNVPPHLRTDARLKQWFESLDIGTVEFARMDTTMEGLKATRKLLERRNRTLKKLERMYMIWAKNIEAERRKRESKHRSWFRSLQLTTLGRRIFGDTASPSGSLPSLLNSIDARLDRGSTFLDVPTIQKLRPKMKKRRRSSYGEIILQDPKEAMTNGVDPNDSIVYYTNKLSKLTWLVKKARAHAYDKELVDRQQENTKVCPTAFVTFSSQRAAQIASQVLLYKSSNPYSMSIRLAPAPQDIIWTAVSMHPLRRSAQSATVAILATVLTFFWTVPASFVASMTNLDTVAKVPTLAPAIAAVQHNERVYFLLKTIGPPFVVNIFNVIIPYMLEFLILKQGLEAYSWVEMRTLQHYFFYLIFNVLLIFTLSSTVWTIAGSLVENPGFIFSLLASTLPSGATFFINYIIINIMMFAIELVRPVIFLYVMFKRWFHKTPRELHELNLETSYLNFGILYPVHLLTFIIVLCYSVIAPLILIPGTIYFAIGYLIYKNQLLYVYVKEWESYGRHWVLGFKRIIIGLIIFQVTMGGIFVTKKAPIAATIPMALIPITLLFYSHCQYAFERKSKHIPLDQLSDKSNDALSPTTGKPRRTRGKGSENGEVDPDVVISADEYQLERYPTSYDNPIFSKPLSRPWLPISVAGWWSLLPRYDSEGDEDEDENEDSKVVDETNYEGERLKTSKVPEIRVEVGLSPTSAQSPLPKAAARLRGATRSGRRGTMSKGVLVVSLMGEGSSLQGPDVVTAPDLQLGTEVPDISQTGSDQ